MDGLKETLGKVSDMDIIRAMSLCGLIVSDKEECYNVQLIFYEVYKIMEQENDKRLRERM